MVKHSLIYKTMLNNISNTRRTRMFKIRAESNHNR